MASTAIVFGQQTNKRTHCNLTSTLMKLVHILPVTFHLVKQYTCLLLCTFSPKTVCRLRLSLRAETSVLFGKQTAEYNPLWTSYFLLRLLHLCLLTCLTCSTWCWCGLKADVGMHHHAASWHLQPSYLIVELHLHLQCTTYMETGRNWLWDEGPTSMKRNQNFVFSLLRQLIGHTWVSLRCTVMAPSLTTDRPRVHRRKQQRQQRQQTLRQQRQQRQQEVWCLMLALVNDVYFFPNKA